MAQLTLQMVEALAPDQASLKAAAGQMKRSKWPTLGRDSASNLFWGECQGSGANPYRVVADASDQGYKCTCPSRKFPCKHTLALMWLFAEQSELFAEAETPEWVIEWIGRRRKSGGASAAPKAGGKSIRAAASTQTAEAAAPAPEDPKVAARREAAAKKRAAETRAAIAGGLDDLDQWIGDQLQGGLPGFLAEAQERCRRIAARLVDAKAQALASRLDETPARIAALRAEERPDAALREFGKLALLARAWRAEPDNPEIRRAVATAETRDVILESADAVRAAGVWEALGERVSTRRDGLISQATYLLNLSGSGPRFALLLDFFPAATGRRGGAFSSGDRFHAELAFYPAARPYRALIAERRAATEEELAAARWPALETGADPLEEFFACQDASPWSIEAPILLPRGRLASQGRGATAPSWWRAAEGDGALPLTLRPDAFAFGLSLSAAAAVWNGARCMLLAAESPVWGRVGFDG